MFSISRSTNSVFYIYVLAASKQNWTKRSSCSILLLPSLQLLLFYYWWCWYSFDCCRNLFTVRYTHTQNLLQKDFWETGSLFSGPQTNVAIGVTNLTEAISPIIVEAENGAGTDSTTAVDGEKDVNKRPNSALLSNDKWCVYVCGNCR